MLSYSIYSLKGMKMPEFLQACLQSILDDAFIQQVHTEPFTNYALRSNLTGTEEYLAFIS